jgi:hypothetical protein
MSVPNQLFPDWQVGDTLTAEKMNQMKNAFAALAGANFTGSLQVSGNTVWHAGNDGVASGLDADTLRGFTPEALLASAEGLNRADVNPTASSDETQGFTKGWLWANTSTAEVFYCSDASEGAAVWFSLTHASAQSVVGRSGSTAGAVADIVAGTDGHVLRRSGTTLGFGQVVAAGIADDAVGGAKIQDLSIGFNEKVYAHWSAVVTSAGNFVSIPSTPSKFTVAKDSTGVYTLTRANGSEIEFYAIVTPTSTADLHAHASKGATSLTVYIRDDSGTLTDSSFAIIIISTDVSF